MYNFHEVTMLKFNKCMQKDTNRLYELSKKLINTYENKNVNFEFIYKWIKNKLNNEIHDYYQILYNNTHVGYIHIINENEIEIDDFYIFDEYQNMGIGTKVLNTIIKNSTKNIFLYVFIKNTKAISLYKKLGFKIIENIKDSRYIMRLSK